MGSRTGVDLNDLATLELYNHLLFFRQDESKNFIEWDDPDSQLQGTLHNLAQFLGLQYEFSLATRIARLSRQNPQSIPAPSAPSPQKIYQLVPESNLHSHDPHDLDLEFLDYLDLEQLNKLDSTLDAISSSEALHGSPISPDLKLRSIEVSTTLVELKPPDCQSLVQPQIEASNNQIYFDGNYPYPSGNQGSNLDATGSEFFEDFSPQPLRDDFDMWLGENSGDIRPESLDVAESMQSMSYFDAQRPPIPPSNPIASSNRNHIKALSTEDVTRKRKQTEEVDSAAQLAPLRRKSSNAASLASSLASSGGSSLADSVNSTESKRHKGTFGLFRRPSVHSGSSCGSQEQVMDWSSELSGSKVAFGVRRGRMDDAARAAMNAVKKAKACWRCKILKKRCSPENPCRWCPKGVKVIYWSDVPCSRGAIKDKVVSVAFCPNDQGTKYVSLHEDEAIAFNPATMYLRATRRRRDEQLMRLGNFASTFCKDRNVWPLNWPLYDVYQHFPVECFRGSRYSSLTSSVPAAVVPLNECILALCWEILHSPTIRTMIETCSGIQSFILLCVSATSYQAKLENDELIAQSLLCLRNAFEALRAQEDGFLERSCHRYCSYTRCKIKCLSDLKANIERYLDEVSRVVLNRGAISIYKPWWLSMFYSACIQSFVRKALLQLPNHRPEACRQHIHLPVRLFVAMSGGHDPLKSGLYFTGQEPEQGPPTLEDFMSAQDAVNFDEWSLKGIRDSGHYLKTLVEDNGDPLLGPQDISEEKDEGLPDKMENLNLLSETERAVPLRADKGADLGDFASYFANQLSGFYDE